MTSRPSSVGRSGRARPKPEGAWLETVADAAAVSAGAPVELLGEYLAFLADAAVSGRRPQDRELEAVRELGRRAAEQGVGADQVVNLYLSAAWRLWRELPMVVRTRDRHKVRAAADAVLRVIDDAVEVLVEGHQAARRQMVRHEEALRREFIDDLLRGDADVSRMLERAEPFGLDLGRTHQVALAAPLGSAVTLDRAAIAVERIILQRFGDREVLTATKDGRVVVLVPGDPPAMSSPRGTPDLEGLIHTELKRIARQAKWRVAAGRAHPGVYGIARSYEEARWALALAEKLRLDTDAVHGRDLLVYRVISRDPAALADLVHSVLSPLTQSRGGAEPLLQTLQTYFATGEIATETARRLHVSVRTVTYRLAKVKSLTAHDVTEPAQRLALHVAVLGARLLDWPAHELPEGG